MMTEDSLGQQVNVGDRVRFPRRYGRFTYGIVKDFDEGFLVLTIGSKKLLYPAGWVELAAK